MYINGQLVKDDINDVYMNVPLGARYEIKDIKPLSGHKYNGVASNSAGLSGVIRSNKEVQIRLKFSTVE